MLNTLMLIIYLLDFVTTTVIYPWSNVQNSTHFFCRKAPDVPVND